MCQAWHRASEVRVLAPGDRRADLPISRQKARSRAKAHPEPAEGASPRGAVVIAVGENQQANGISVRCEESITAPWGTVSPKGLSYFRGTLQELLKQEIVSATSVCPVSAVKISLAHY